MSGLSKAIDNALRKIAAEEVFSTNIEDIQNGGVSPREQWRRDMESKALRSAEKAANLAHSIKRDRWYHKVDDYGSPLLSLGLLPFGPVGWAASAANLANYGARRLGDYAITELFRKPKYRQRAQEAAQYRQNIRGGFDQWSNTPTNLGINY